MSRLRKHWGKKRGTYHGRLGQTPGQWAPPQGQGQKRRPRLWARVRKALWPFGRRQKRPDQPDVEFTSDWLS